MKAFVAGVVVAIVLAVIAGVALQSVQQPVWQAFATQGARVAGPQ